MRAAPYLLGALLAASVAFNVRTFLHYQDPATIEPLSMNFHPIQFESFTSLVGASAVQLHPLIRLGTHDYYVAAEILKGRKVTMPRLSPEELWPWRHIVLADIQILDKETRISRSQSRRYRSTARSVLRPGPISLERLPKSPPIFVLIAPDAPPDVGVRIVQDHRGRLFMLPERRAEGSRRDGS